MAEISAMIPDLRALLGLEDDAEDGLLAVLLRQAAATALTVTGRTALPDGLRGAVLDLAVLRYNRRGLEGESVRAEGGVTARMDALPEDVRRALRMYTLARPGVNRCAPG